MPLVKYRIYELSARAVISYGRQQDGTYTFHLSAAETEKCKSLSAPHEQDDNALFYQIMCVLHGDAFTRTPDGQLVTDLSDIIFYMDFSGIFDRERCQKEPPDSTGEGQGPVPSRGREPGFWLRAASLSCL